MLGVQEVWDQVYVVSIQMKFPHKVAYKRKFPHKNVDGTECQKR